jgi:Peptidase family M20/M25/M40
MRGSDGGAKPIPLLAHIDVVEAKRDEWVRDPFTLVEENGWFYARGSSDDKAMAAVFTDTLVRYRKEGFKHRRAQSKIVAPDLAADMQAVLRNPHDEAAVEKLWAVNPGWNGMLRTMRGNRNQWGRSGERAAATCDRQCKLPNPPRGTDRRSAENDRERAGRSENQREADGAPF